VSASLPVYKASEYRAHRLPFGSLAPKQTRVATVTAVFFNAGPISTFTFIFAFMVRVVVFALTTASLPVGNQCQELRFVIGRKPEAVHSDVYMSQMRGCLLELPYRSEPRSHTRNGGVTEICPVLKLKNQVYCFCDKPYLLYLDSEVRQGLFALSEVRSCDVRCSRSRLVQISEIVCSCFPHVGVL
jgi:hypothetical protein